MWLAVKYVWVIKSIFNVGLYNFQRDSVSEVIKVLINIALLIAMYDLILLLY